MEPAGQLSQSEYTSRCVGCMLGGFAGDALGAPVEMGGPAAIRTDPGANHNVVRQGRAATF